MKISINQAPKYTGQEVTIGCWLLQKRGSGKLQFLQLRDGTGFMQGVVVKANDEELFTAAKGLHQEASMYVTGTIKEDERSSFGYEMEVSGLEIIQNNEGYPITPKEHGPEFLLDNRHLWLRSRKQHAVMNIRNQIIKSTYDFYFDNGFKKIDSPILTSSSPEGTTELFHTKYFDEDAYLSQSGQLYAEAGAMAHGKVFTFGPTFRAEKSKTRRHLIEFWMIEPEMAFCDLEQDMDVAEDMIKYIINDVLENCPEEMEFFNSFVDKGLLERLDNIVSNDFARITYTEAVEILQKSGKKFEYPVEWGLELQTEHERYITEEVFKKPVFVTDYPKCCKAFYMRVNDDNKTVAAMDMLVPGVGEIIGGSQREERYDVLVERIREMGLCEENYDWYLDLRKYGGVKHAGYGLGFDRILMYMTGMSNIRDVQMFPRTPGNAEF